MMILGILAFGVSALYSCLLPFGGSRVAVPPGKMKSELQRMWGQLFNLAPSPKVFLSSVCIFSAPKDVKIQATETHLG